jgi:hypothetical protein
MTMANPKANSAKSSAVDDPQVLTSALPDTPGSPTQSATEGEVDTDRESPDEQNPSPIVSEEDIRQRAYELWESNGRVDGSEDEYWHQAREQLHAAFQRAE